MKVKGTAVRVIPDYIKANFPQYYSEWLNNLPENSKNIFENTILAATMYELYDAHVVPTRVLAEILAEEDKKVARDIGRFSAENALKGVYSVFLKMSSFRFAVKRVPMIFKTYYSPAEVDLLKSEEGDVLIKFGKLEQKELLLFYRNMGWTEVFARMSLGVEADVKLEITEENGGFYGLFSIKF